MHIGKNAGCEAPRGDRGPRKQPESLNPAPPPFATRALQASGAARLGTLSVARSGPMGFAEVWEDGQAFQELAQRAAALQRHREEIEAARKVGGTELMRFCFVTQLGPGWGFQ